MTTYLSGLQGNPGPACKAIALDALKSDTVALTTYVRAIHVGTAGGAIVVILAGDSSTVTLYGELGATIPVVVKQVYSTGTTATGLIGLYD